MDSKTNSPDIEGHNDQIPVQTIFTFNDLCEDVLNKVAKYLPLEERGALTRTSRMVGRCCNALWVHQKRLPLEFQSSFRKYYYRVVLMCPNLREFAPGEENSFQFHRKLSLKDMQQVLATSCPRIESFKGPLDLLVAYLNVLKDRNSIKSIHLTQLGENYSFFFPIHPPKYYEFHVLADYLIDLKFMTMESRPGDKLPENLPQLKILGQRVSGINIKFRSYESMYQHFEPGNKLEVLEDGISFNLLAKHKLPMEFDARHPKLKKIGSLDATAYNLRILNRIQYLETVGLHFKANSGTDEIMELFRSFLLIHIHLKRLKILFVSYKNRHNEVVQAICELRPWNQILGPSNFGSFPVCCYYWIQLFGSPSSIDRSAWIYIQRMYNACRLEYEHIYAIVCFLAKNQTGQLEPFP